MNTQRNKDFIMLMFLHFPFCLIKNSFDVNLYYVSDFRKNPDIFLKFQAKNILMPF